MLPKGSPKLRRKSGALTKLRQAASNVVRVAWPVPGYQANAGSIVPGHEALDISAPTGTPAVAARAGIVRVENGQYGQTVRIQDAQTGLEQIYGHLSQILVRAGQVVRPGETVGLVGATGAHSGGVSHLHYEVNPIGPEHFAGQRADVAAVDPWQFLEGFSMTSPVGIADNRNVMQVTSTAKGGKPTRGGGVLSASRASSLGDGSTSTVKVGSAPLGVSQRQGLDPGSIKGSATVAKADDSRLFPGGPRTSTVTGWAQRIGLWGMGGALFLVGVLILAWSFRDEIEAGVGKATDTVAKVGVGAAAGGPAGAALGAVGAASG